MCNKAANSLVNWGILTGLLVVNKGSWSCAHCMQALKLDLYRCQQSVRRSAEGDGTHFSFGGV